MKILRVLLGIILVMLIVVLATLTKVDRSPISEQDFYAETFQRLSQTNLTASQGGAWLAGWSKSNMTPDQPVDLVGYAPRGDYEFVLDSSYVKAMTVTNGKTRVAWLNYELLIVHPSLAAQVQHALDEKQIPVDQVIFTATHTHSGMGGYMPGPIGQLAFGGYDQTVVDLMVSASISALQNSIGTEDTVSITFRKLNAGNLIANRFVENGPIDPFVRQLIFQKVTGEKGTLLTYSAHATTLPTKFMGLSGDYPFYLTKNLESRGFEFAMYAAGTVGSHGPLPPGNTPNMAKKYAHDLDSTMGHQPAVDSAVINNPVVKTAALPIALRDPQLRVSDNIRLRPWLFDYLLGKTNAHLDITQIGSVLLISSSGELSGVFMRKWDKLAQQNGLNLIITTFNGGYVGYITPDELYDRHFHEVREMNWYGPGNGQYFDELITRVIEKASN